MSIFSVLHPSSQISFGPLGFIFFVLLTTAMLFCIRSRIKVLLVLFFVFVPFREEFVFSAGATWRLTDIFGMQLVGFTILAFLKNPLEPRFRDFPYPIGLIMLFYVAICFISLALAPALPFGIEENFSGRNVPMLRGLTQLARWAYTFLLVYSLYVNIESRQEFQRLIKLLCITAFVISSLTVIFYALWKLDLLNRATASILVDRINPHRVSGLDFEPSNFSFYLVISMILSAWLLYKKSIHLPWKLPSWIILLPQIMAFTLAQSAIGIIIMGSSLVLCGLEIRYLLAKSNRRLNLPVREMVLGLCVTVMVMLVFMGVTDRPRFLFNPTLKAASFFGRVGGVLTDLNMYAAHPDLGVGIGNYMYHFGGYVSMLHPVGEDVDFSGFQSVFTGAFAETGFPGGLAILMLVLALLLQAHAEMARCYRDENAEMTPYFAVFLAAAVYLCFTPFMLGHTVLLPLVLPLLASRLTHCRPPAGETR